MKSSLSSFAWIFRGALLATTACSIAMTGCSRSSTGLVPTEGRVEVNGKPAVGAIVTFHPISGPDAAPRPSGRVDANGMFHLTTARTDDGAAPGDYKVTVAWYLASAGKRGTPADEVVPVPQLPASYALASGTPLTATIRAGSTETLEFRIKR